MKLHLVFLKNIFRYLYLKYGWHLRIVRSPAPPDQQAAVPRDGRSAAKVRKAHQTARRGQALAKSLTHFIPSRVRDFFLVTSNFFLSFLSNSACSVRTPDFHFEKVRGYFYRIVLNFRVLFFGFFSLPSPPLGICHPWKLSEVLSRPKKDNSPRAVMIVSKPFF